MKQDDAELRCVHCGKQIVADDYIEAQNRYSDHVKTEHGKPHQVRP